MCFFRIVIVLATFVALTSCNRTAEYEARGRTLDSLGGAINNLAAALQKHDTVVLSNHIKQFSYYSNFIEASHFDTLGKNAADHLQNFYHSGTTLKTFLVNRTAILARIALLNSQYKRLSEDIRNHSISLESADAFVEQEKKEAVRVVDVGVQQQQLFYRSIEQYRLSVKAVQQIIMQYNNGQLPTIVSDSIPQL